MSGEILGVNKHRAKNSKLEPILFGIIHQKEAAGVVAGPGNAQQPDCSHKAIFLFQRILHMYWGKTQVKGKNK